jgi:hypothetical protein
MNHSTNPVMTPTQQHPLEDVIEAYCLNRIDPIEKENFETHLLFCQICRAATAECDEYLFYLKAGLREQVAKQIFCD